MYYYRWYFSPRAGNKKNEVFKSYTGKNNNDRDGRVTPGATGTMGSVSRHSTNTEGPCICDRGGEVWDVRGNIRLESCPEEPIVSQKDTVMETKEIVEVNTNIVVLSDKLYESREDSVE